MPLTNPNNYYAEENIPARPAASGVLGEVRNEITSQPFDPSYIDPGQAFQGKQGASELLGQLSRAQWEDWKNRFAPYITKLADYATDPNAAADAADQAKSSVGLAFDTATTVNNQNRDRYGVSLSPEQMAAQERSTKVGRTAAMASAGNEARISALDRQQAILAGGMGLSNIPDRVMNS
ncbi:hypothetical protein [Marinobacter salarius]|uniref:hypothetical protein n=1 Tax=Marinobacter salarius TaxID=1420917 RepID=UPI003D0A0848